MSDGIGATPPTQSLSSTLRATRSTAGPAPTPRTACEPPSPAWPATAVPVHPNAFNAVRPRWGAARAKDDPGDAFKLADYLRTDGHRLRTLRPTEQATLELQALVRAREDQVTARVAATNQLAESPRVWWRL